MINGIHHVSFKCSKGEQLKKVIAFYTETLGMMIVRQWGPDWDNPIGVMSVSYTHLTLPTKLEV